MFVESYLVQWAGFAMLLNPALILARLFMFILLIFLHLFVWGLFVLFFSLHKSIPMTAPVVFLLTSSLSSLLLLVIRRASRGISFELV